MVYQRKDIFFEKRNKNLVVISFTRYNFNQFGCIVLPIGYIEFQKNFLEIVSWIHSVPHILKGSVTTIEYSCFIFILVTTQLLTMMQHLQYLYAFSKNWPHTVRLFLSTFRDKNPPHAWSWQKEDTLCLFVGNIYSKDMIRIILEKVRIIPTEVFHLEKKIVLILFRPIGRCY